MARTGFNDQYVELDQWFTENSNPTILCGVCKDGYLSVENIDKKEDTDSNSSHEHPDWEPEWITGLISVSLSCSKPTCKAIAVAIGRWRVVFDVVIEHDDYGNPIQVPTYKDEFKIVSILPTSPLVITPAGTPEIVEGLLVEAASIAPTSPGAAANRIRTAIDELLTAHGVARYRVAARLRRKIRISTHERIDIFRAKNAEAADMLLAVKWIGNNGTHTDTVSIQEVLDGAELFSHALEMIYDTKKVELKKKAKKINARKGKSERK
jgi:hypothetical protein